MNNKSNSGLDKIDSFYKKRFLNFLDCKKCSFILEEPSDLNLSVFLVRRFFSSFVDSSRIKLKRLFNLTQIEAEHSTQNIPSALNIFYPQLH